MAQSTSVFASYGHQCDLEYEDTNDLKYVIPGDTFLTKLHRCIISRVVTTSEISKFRTHHLRSYSSTITERNRQLQYYSFKIHPFSIARMYWIIFIGFVMFLQIICVPVDCLFDNFKHSFISSQSWIVFRNVCDFICCLNILLTLITGYYDEPKQIVVMDCKSIFIHYLKTTMIFDIIVSFPTNWDLFGSVNTETINNYLQIMTMCKVFFMVAWFAYIKKISDFFGLKYYHYLTFTVLLFTICFWHASCCILLFIRITSHGRNYPLFDYFAHAITVQENLTRKHHPFESNVLNAYYKSVNGAFGLYIGAIYHGSFVIATAGYGKDIPRNDVDYLAVCFLWYFSRTFFVFIIALILQIIKGESSSRYKYVLMEKQLIYYMRQKQFSSYLQCRILTYYHFRFHRRFFKEHEIMATLSEQLKQEINMQSCQKLVESVVFFSNLPLKLLVKIISCLKKEIFLINDVIIRANTPATSMYFISVGTVAVYTKTGKEICHLHDGSYFGEVALLIKDTLRIASVVAVEISEIYRLDHKDFVKAINPYPDLLTNIKKIAADRMEVATILDEYYQRELEEKNYVYKSSSLS